MPLVDVQAVAGSSPCRSNSAMALDWLFVSRSFSPHLSTAQCKCLNNGLCCVSASRSSFGAPQIFTSRNRATLIWAWVIDLVSTLRKASDILITSGIRSEIPWCVFIDQTGGVCQRSCPISSCDFLLHSVFRFLVLRWVQPDLTDRGPVPCMT